MHMYVNTATCNDQGWHVGKCEPEQYITQGLAHGMGLHLVSYIARYATTYWHAAGLSVYEGVGNSFEYPPTSPFQTCLHDLTTAKSAMSKKVNLKSKGVGAVAASKISKKWKINGGNRHHFEVAEEWRSWVVELPSSSA